MTLAGRAACARARVLLAPPAVDGVPARVARAAACSVVGLVGTNLSPPSPAPRLPCSSPCRATSSGRRWTRRWAVLFQTTIRWNDTDYDESISQGGSRGCAVTLVERSINQGMHRFINRTASEACAEGTLTARPGLPAHPQRAHALPRSPRSASPAAPPPPPPPPPHPTHTHTTQMLRRYWSAFPAGRGAVPAEAAERIMIFQRGAEVVSACSGETPPGDPAHPTQNSSGCWAARGCRHRRTPGARSFRAAMASMLSLASPPLACRPPCRAPTSCSRSTCSSACGCCSRCTRCWCGS